MASIKTYWEIGFKSEGDYKSYDALIQAALNDDCYQKIYPGIASEILLENLLTSVQDVNNRPTRDGIDHGTLYKKPNGRQIDSSRRYYLVKEPKLDEFNLYVKITKGRNLGYYRIYTNKNEAELLIEYGLNYVKSQGSLPIIADYFNFAQSSKHFVARERCEFISRLLNSNIVATTKTLKHDYNIKELGKRKGLQRVVLPTHASSSSSVIKKKIVRSQSSSSERSKSSSCERSQSSSSERSESSLTKKQKNSKLIKKQQQQQKAKARAKKAVDTSKLLTISSPDARDTTITKNSTPEKPKKSNTSRSSLINRSTPIINRLRTKPNGRNAAASSLSIASTSHIVPTNEKSKNKQIVNFKKRSHPSDDEKNNENAPPLSDSSTSANAKSIKSKNGDGKSKRLKH